MLPVLTTIGDERNVSPLINGEGIRTSKVRIFSSFFPQPELLFFLRQLSSFPLFQTPDVSVASAKISQPSNLLTLKNLQSMFPFFTNRSQKFRDILFSPPAKRSLPVGQESRIANISPRCSSPPGASPLARSSSSCPAVITPPSRIAASTNLLAISLRFHLQFSSLCATHEAYAFYFCSGGEVSSSVLEKTVYGD